MPVIQVLSIYFDVIQSFDTIYPYCQLLGFSLEKIGFTKQDLTVFKANVTDLSVNQNHQRLTKERLNHWHYEIMINSQYDPMQVTPKLGSKLLDQMAHRHTPQSYTTVANYPR
jgi:hypothetical protein